MMLNEDVLRVRMLGEFSMTWNGTEICDGSKSADAQFTRLLQLLLYRRKEGVERTKLQTLLFDDSNSDDVHHLLRSVIYNARKKLEKSCLPEANYIEFRGGRYYWTGDIPTRLDTEEFETLCAAADAETDEEARLKKYLAAIDAYKGGFLPNQTRLTWAAAEEDRYKEMFGNCVEAAAAILRYKKDYDGLEKLGRKAAIVSPLNEWEYLILEAYVFTGRVQKAHVLHEKTIDQYRKRLGSISLAEYTEMVEQVLGQSETAYQDIKDIARLLSEDQRSGSDAYYCSYPVFYGIYHMLGQLGALFKATPYVILCSVSPQGGRSLLEEDALEKRSERAKAAILASAENGTAVCRFGKGQYLIMLMDGSRERCKMLIDRIKKAYKAKRRGADELSFSMMPAGGAA